MRKQATFLTFLVSATLAANLTSHYLLSSDGTSDSNLASFEDALLEAGSRPSSTIFFLQPNVTAVIIDLVTVSTKLRIEGQGGELLVCSSVLIRQSGQLSLLEMRIQTLRDIDEPIFTIEGSLLLQQISLLSSSGVAISLISGELVILNSDFKGGDSFLSITDDADVYCEHCRFSNFQQSIVQVYPSSSCSLRKIKFTASWMDSISGAVLRYLEKQNCEMTFELNDSTINDKVQAFADGKLSKLNIAATNTTFVGLTQIVTGTIENSTLAFMNCTIESIHSIPFAIDLLQGIISITAGTIRNINIGPIFYVSGSSHADALIILEDCSVFNISNPSLSLSGGVLHISSVTAIISSCEVWGLNVLKDGFMYVNFGVASLSNVLYRDSRVSITSIMNGVFSKITATNFTVARVQNNDGAVMATLPGTSGYWRNVSVVGSIDVSPVPFNDFITLWVGYYGVFSVESSYFRNVGPQLLSMAATNHGVLNVVNSVFADLTCSRTFDVFLSGIVNLKNVTFQGLTTNAIVRCVQNEYCSDVQNLYLDGEVHVGVLFSLTPGQATMTNVHFTKVSTGVLKAIDSTFTAVNNSFTDSHFLFCRECIGSRITIDNLTVERVHAENVFELLLMHVEITGLHFRDVEAEQVFVLTGSTLALHDFSAVMCLFSELGGLVEAEEGSSVSFEASTLVQVGGKTSMTSGLISMQNSVLRIANCSFEDFNITLISSTGSEVAISDSHFQHGGPPTSRNLCGGVLKAASSRQLSISDSSFVDTAAAVGGAICISQQESLSSLQRVTVIGCSSMSSGGAMFIEGATVLITDSTFAENTAIRGGAIWANSASLSISNSSFQFNFADLDGGAIQYISSSLTYDQATAFVNNSAVYGPTVASQYSMIKQMEGGKTIATAVHAASGQRVNNSLSFGLFDSLGQLVTTDNTTQLRLYCAASGEEVSGSVLLYPENGVYTAANLFIVGAPLSNVRVFGETKSFSGYIFTAQLRGCETGEWLADSRCVVCTNNMYSFDPSKPCALCPASAQCFEGFKLNLKAGYWRSSNVTDRIYSCLVEQLCLGGFTEQCAQGHHGIMCNECEAEYFKGSQMQCFACWSTGIALFKGLAFALLAVGSTLFASPSHSSEMLIYVLANYFLMLRILANLSLLWPAPIGFLLVVLGDIGSAGLTAFTDMCASGITQLKHVYSQFLLVLVYYCVLETVVYLLALLFRSRYRTNPNTAAFFMGMCALPLLFLHSTQLLACYEIDGVHRLVYDPSIQCWTSTHQKFVLGLALPVMLGCVSVPALLLREALKEHSPLLSRWQAAYIVITLCRSFLACSFLVHSKSLALCMEAALVLLLNTATELLLRLVARLSLASAVYQSTLSATTLFTFACLIYSTTSDRSKWEAALLVVSYLLLTAPLFECLARVLTRRKKRLVVPALPLQKEGSLSCSLEVPPPSLLADSQVPQLDSSLYRAS